MNLTQIEERLKKAQVSLSDNDNLATAKKCMVPGPDIEGFKVKNAFYHRMHGEVVYSDSFVESLHSFLDGHYDMVLTEIDALCDEEKQFVSELNNDIFDVRHMGDGRIIIDTGKLEF
ncbi:MAG: hypothetical protein CML22_06835 [Rheinheimera sp.]|nr:hypothetical protein [Rheinheimera sp.]MBM33998.1 hypothetical protein [Rheinheimera sp.]|tara:strand:+ start:581 stop:931 length:351 start_codon:yes stop_codon:yes gene_type:complete